MNGLDIVIIVILGLSFINGLVRGFSKQISILVGIPLGLIIAVLFAASIGDFLGGFSPVAKFADILPGDNPRWWLIGFSFILIFIVSYFLIHWLFSAFKKGFDAIQLGVLDIFLGGFVGLFVGSLVVSLILFALQSFPEETLSIQDILAIESIEDIFSLNEQSPMREWSVRLLNGSTIFPYFSGYYNGVVSVFSSFAGLIKF